MRLETRCGVCARDFLLVMALAPGSGPARCPFCGVQFSVDVVDLDEFVVTQASGEAALTHIGRLLDMRPGFVLDLVARSEPPARWVVVTADL